MNYPYTSIQLIDGEIKAVVNKEAKPNVMINHPNYNDIMMLWQQKHEVFEFANPHEEGKIMRHIAGMNPKIKYAIEVTCIEIKDGKGWFKDEKERGITITNKEDQFAIYFSEWCYCNYRFNQTVNEWQSNTTLKIFTTKQLINEFKITQK